MRFYLNHIKPLKLPQPKCLDLSQSCYLSSKLVFRLRALFIDKLYMIFEPAEPSAWLLGLG